ncbi:MAG: TetR/AcrR family transcriptional regulator [Suilimivivens sp.]
MGRGELAPKVEAIYQAVIQLYMEGADLNNLTVSEITAKAGIGKGTAYDYFSNKEEMIAGALFYEMKNACQRLYKCFKQEKDLYGKIYVLLTQIERQLTGTGCFFRALHVMMDHSSVGTRVRELIQNREDDELLINDLLRGVIEEELANAKVSPEDREYLVLNAVSKIICFTMFQYDKKNMASLNPQTLKEKICEDICSEIERLKES